MAVGRAGLLRHIHRLWDLGTDSGLTDAQLLARFAARHEDGAEPAFEALVPPKAARLLALELVMLGSAFGFLFGGFRKAAPAGTS